MRITLRWEQQKDGNWRLSPSPVSVRKTGDYWEILIVDRPTNLRYASEQGAKMDAWQLIKSQCKALLGTYRVRLAD